MMGTQQMNELRQGYIVHLYIYHVMCVYECVFVRVCACVLYIKYALCGGSDMFRAGIRYRTPEPGNYDSNILYYVMTHWPGNAPTSFKRLFFAALAHGTKIIDLYEMHSTAFTTENSVGEYPNADNGTYETVQDTLYEFGQFDDVIQSVGSQAAAPADVAVFFSTAADVWMGDRDGPCTYMPKGGTTCTDRRKDCFCCPPQ